MVTLCSVSQLIHICCIDVDLGVFRPSFDIFSEDDSNIYQLDVFGTNSIDSITTTNPASSRSSHDGNNETKEDRSETVDDIWTSQYVIQSSAGFNILNSWDINQPEIGSTPLFLSEAGNHGYDAALAHQATQTGLENAGRIAQFDYFINSLFQAGLGWNSVFFVFNEQKRVFEKVVLDARVSGISITTIDGLIKEVVQCGTWIRKLRRFIFSVPTRKIQPSSFSALVHVTSVLLGSMEEYVSKIADTKPTLLQAHLLFQRCGCLIQSLVHITDSVENSRSDGPVISDVFRKCDYFSRQYPWLTEILHEIVMSVSHPWLVLLESWIGLRPEPQTLIELDGNGTGFISPSYTEEQPLRKQRNKAIAYDFRPEAMPIFVPSNHAQQIFTSGIGLRLLQKFQPDHPLIQPRGIQAKYQLSLSYAITWSDLERIQLIAYDYEKKLQKDILKYHNGILCQWPRSDKICDVQDGDSAPIMSTYKLIDLDRPLSDEDFIFSRSLVTKSKFCDLLRNSGFFDLNAALEDQCLFGPPLSSSIYLSFAPVISAQTRLINYSCLHLLCKKHKLRDHLQLQWRFQLFGDGVFSSRLSDTLFDPDMRSGERKIGVATAGISTGLRLGSRDNWPPASSELRLVLSNLLTECYGNGNGELRQDNELPGGLSFAIRSLSGEDFINFQNPNSIEALDFLRLQYRPSHALESIITTRSLEKYDLLFKHLLRIVRMLSVAKGLVRDSTFRRQQLKGRTHLSLVHKFRLEASHFIQAVGKYAFEIAIDNSWKRFDKTLKKIESGIDNGDVDGTIAHARGSDQLREYHEDILDQMLFALFLSKPTARANRLLNDIFGTLLLFAPISNIFAVSLDSDSPKKIAFKKRLIQLHVTFRKQANEFIGFLRQLKEMQVMHSKVRQPDLAIWGSDAKLDTGTNGVFEHLLLRLNFIDYY